MMKKTLSAFMALCLTMAVLAGCSQSPVASGEAQASKLEEVLKKGKIVVGITLSFPPFGMKDANGEPEGYDVDLAKLLADSLGVELEIVDVVGESRIPSLETDKIDVMFGNFTRTLARAQKVDFTEPYITAAQRLIVPADSDIQRLEDMDGKVVAVLKGSTNADVIARANVDAEVSYLPTAAEAILAVKNGQADAFIEDSNFLAYQAKLNPDLKVVGEPLSHIEYNSFGIRKGDQNWLNYLNLFIYEINVVTDDNAELYEKWFGAEMPYKLNPEY